jgi:hypothetical protein
MSTLQIKYALEIWKNKELMFPTVFVLLQSLNRWLEDGTNISSADRGDLVESLNATLRKLGHRNGGANCASSGSKCHLSVILLLK